MNNESQIAIYTAPNGDTQIDVTMREDTIWLTQDAMARLFQTTTPNINMHIRNILKEGELERAATIKDFLIVRTEGRRRVSRNIAHYNLDMVLSVGYRIKSKTATQFRIWATKTLREYLTQGFVINQRALAQQRNKLLTLQRTLDLMTRSITHQAETLSQAQDVGRLLGDFVKGLNLLDDFDHESLDVKGRSAVPAVQIASDEFLTVVDQMKGQFASSVFAQPKDDSFYSSVAQIYQTFGGGELYPTLEEKAAMLLYLVVKNHSFVDGNKRIAASCFLYFLDRNNMLYSDTGAPIIDNATLFALTLLIAESNPAEKDTIKQVIISVLNRVKPQ